MIKAQIVRGNDGICRVYCQRARRKWWFELGKHRETDAAFEDALGADNPEKLIQWKPKIDNHTKLF